MLIFYIYNRLVPRKLRPLKVTGVEKPLDDLVYEKVDWEA
jgi:hypothetical protein